MRKEHLFVEDSLDCLTVCSRGKHWRREADEPACARFCSACSNGGLWHTDFELQPTHLHGRNLALEDCRVFRQSWGHFRTLPNTWVHLESNNDCWTFLTGVRWERIKDSNKRWENTLRKPIATYRLGTECLDNSPANLGRTWIFTLETGAHLFPSWQEEFK